MARPKKVQKVKEPVRIRQRKLANEYLVARYGIKGGAYGFLTSVMVLFLIFYFCIIYTILKKNKKILRKS